MSKLCPVSEFANLSSRARLSYLLPLLTACSHDELLTVQSALSQLFYCDFISHLPSDLSLLILTNLSFRDLLACMLVNSTWYNILQHNVPLWKYQSKLLVPIQIIYPPDNQWKQLCRNAKLFQSKLHNSTAYCVDQFVISSEMKKIFELLNSSDYLLIHGLVGDKTSLYKDVILVWKWEGNEFKFKKDILETVDIGGYQFQINSKSGSKISPILLSSTFLIVVHSYIEVFDLKTLSLFCRICLPSFSGVKALDFTENSDNSPKLFAIAFFDDFIYIIEPSSGATIYKFEIKDGFFELFSFFDKPTPSILVHSEQGTRRFIIFDGQSHMIDTLGGRQDTEVISSKISKDKEIVAFLEWKELECTNIIRMIVFTTSNWKLVYHTQNVIYTSYYVILEVGRRYVVILNTKAKLEFLIYDIQLAQPPRKIVFDNFQPRRDIFSTDHVLVLSSNGWLDGKVFDKFGEEGTIIPIFIVLTQSTPCPLTLLSLTY